MGRSYAKVNYMYSSDQLVLLVAQLQRELASTRKQVAHLSGINMPAVREHGAKEQRRLQRTNTHPDWPEIHSERDREKPRKPNRRRTHCGTMFDLNNMDLGSSGSAPSLGE